MLIQPTLDTLNRLKLHGMALALSEQMTNGAAQGLAFEERLAFLLDREALHREALEWSTTRGARSGRVAWQFVQDLAGRLGIRMLEDA